MDENPERLIGDRAYDSDPLDEKLAEQGILLIAPHKSNRKKPKTQDGRELRRYRRRWKVERLFAWLQNYRRILVRYDRFLENYLAFVHLACIVILSETIFEKCSSKVLAKKQEGRLCKCRGGSIFTVCSIPTLIFRQHHPC